MSNSSASTHLDKRVYHCFIHPIRRKSCMTWSYSHHRIICDWIQVTSLTKHNITYILSLVFTISQDSFCDNLSPDGFTQTKLILSSSLVGVSSSSFTVSSRGCTSATCERTWGGVSGGRGPPIGLLRCWRKQTHFRLHRERVVRS